MKLYIAYCFFLVGNEQVNEQFWVGLDHRRNHQNKNHTVLKHPAYDDTRQLYNFENSNNSK